MSISVLNTDAGASGKTLVTAEGADTVTGLKTFDRDPSAPFAVTASSAVVANLDADKLDGQEGAYYLDPANLSSAVPIAKGGTGAATANANVVFAGPTSGGAAAPSFRALVNADIPSNVSVLDRDVTATTLASSTTETTVFTSTIAANTLGSTKQLRLILIGDYLNNSGGNDTFTLRTKFGATTVLSAAPSLSTSANRRTVRLEVLLSAENATNAQRVNGVCMFQGTSNGVAGSMESSPVVMLGSHASVAEDSTGALAFVVTAQHGASSANISFIAHSAVLELLN